jgi:predicted ArsR family transcriptional regulator
MKTGLAARTRILEVLDKHVWQARVIANEASLSYEVVIHHLRLLEAEGTVNRRGKRPFLWVLTGLGQKRLVE